MPGAVPVAKDPRGTSWEAAGGAGPEAHFATEYLQLVPGRGQRGRGKGGDKRTESPEDKFQPFLRVSGSWGETMTSAEPLSAAGPAGRVRGGDSVTHNLLRRPLEGEFLQRQTASALGEPSCVSPGLRQQGSHPIHPASPVAPGRNPELLEPRSLEECPSVKATGCAGEERGTHRQSFAVSSLFPYLTPFSWIHWPWALYY